MTNKQYIIEIFTGLGFKKREEFTSFVQLDSGYKELFFSVVITQERFYIMLHTKTDFIFSNHFKIDLTEDEIQKIIRKFIGLYEHFKTLFWEQKKIIYNLKKKGA